MIFPTTACFPKPESAGGLRRLKPSRRRSKAWSHYRHWGDPGWGARSAPHAILIRHPWKEHRNNSWNGRLRQQIRQHRKLPFLPRPRHQGAFHIAGASSTRYRHEKGYLWQGGFHLSCWIRNSTVKENPFAGSKAKLLFTIQPPETRFIWHLPHWDIP